MEAASEAIRGASGKAGAESGMVGAGLTGGGVKTRACVFCRKQDVDASDSAKIPKINRVLRMQCQT